MDAVALVTGKESVALFTKYNVYSERELHSRQEILLERYIKDINIEAQTASQMAHTMILPACLKYQAKVAQALQAADACGVKDAAQAALLKDVVSSISVLRKGALKLDELLADAPHGGAMAHAKYQRDTILPAMLDLRKVADKLELLVSDEYWPLPKYREMLFVR